jgi:hypothetical protein
MSLLLIELSLNSEQNFEISKISEFAEQNNAEVIESQTAIDHSHAFIILQSEDTQGLQASLQSSDFPIKDIAAVRLVGADIDQVKANRPAGNFLVEWDLPEGLTMEKYLDRKKEKAPLYDQVPEVQFLRTYVREDMIKCLCFYDGENESDVMRARDVVSAPVDRIYKLEED